MSENGTVARLKDDFAENIQRGSVINSKASSEITRYGRDEEGVLSVEQNTLRIDFPTFPGWNRHGVTYGPFKSESGLAFSVFLINGHNNSQTKHADESYVKYLLKGIFRQMLIKIPDNTLPVFLKKKKVPEISHYINWPAYSENLVVGWCESKNPPNPTKNGNSFIMRATGVENGQLLLQGGRVKMAALSGLQNIPYYYIGVIRENDILYYISSLESVEGIPAYSKMRPLYVMPKVKKKSIFLGIYQSVIGEVGFKAATRVYGVRANKITDWKTWYSSAYFHDKFESKQDSKLTTQKNNWRVIAGDFHRSHLGLRATAQSNTTIVEGIHKPCLIHVLVSNINAVKFFGIIWRYEDEKNYYQLQFEKTEAHLIQVKQGSKSILYSTKNICFEKGVNSIQLSDYAGKISLVIDQNFIEGFCTLGPNDNLKKVGFYAEEPSKVFAIQRMEMHAEEIDIPAELKIKEPWQVLGVNKLIEDSFSGELTNLDKSNTGLDWQKEVGDGLFYITGKNGAKVKADLGNPNPGRTAYTTEWKENELADLEVEILPPGSERWQGHKGRSGLIFVQDKDNYIIINTWLEDRYGASISSFFYLDGREDLYKAVWTNVGKRIYWGKPYNLRVVFDGMNYQAYLNGEAVLYRALSDIYPAASRLKINRVGIVANWEFGDDTGSEFRNFIGRSL